MHMHSDSLLPIRSQLYDQIEALERDCRSMTLPALCEAVDAIRAIAGAYRLDVVEHVARAFERSIARDRRQTAFALYLDQLKQAAGCSPDAGPDVTDAMLAAIFVRQRG